MSSRKIYLTIKNNTSLRFDLSFIKMKWGKVDDHGSESIKPGYETLIYLANKSSKTSGTEGYIQYLFNDIPGSSGITLHTDFTYWCAYLTEVVFYNNDFYSNVYTLPTGKIITVNKTQKVNHLQDGHKNYYVELNFNEI